MAEQILEAVSAIARKIKQDVIIGVVAPTGIDRESFASRLEEFLDEFGYKPETMHVANIMQKHVGITLYREPYGKYVEKAMTMGTFLRERIGLDALARAVMWELGKDREERDKKGDQVPRVYLIWSLKHPEEVTALRLVYGNAFHMVGLHAPRDSRIRRLSDKKGVGGTVEAGRIIERDENEKVDKAGQQTEKVFHMADVFLSWGRDTDAMDDENRHLERFIDLVFGDHRITPEEDEHGMFLAYSSSLRSGDLSRQVGAALVGHSGDVIALGANDAPRFGGVRYWPEVKGDMRDVGKGQDANVIARLELFERVAEKFTEVDKQEVIRRLSESPLKHITEYGRAVHAEMDALMACARIGVSAMGGTLYVTTYPCHNCARHIVAAGLRRVVFVEPYRKSKAKDLHDDAIEHVPPKGGKGGVDQTRVGFERFVGVGPRRFLDYYSMVLGDGYELVRKVDDSGKLRGWSRADAAPRAQWSDAGYESVESEVGRLFIEAMEEFRSGSGLKDLEGRLS